MIIRDGDGDLWEELESGEYACLTSNMTFYSLDDLDRLYGPLEFYRLSADPPEMPLATLA